MSRSSRSKVSLGPALGAGIFAALLVVYHVFLIIGGFLADSDYVFELLPYISSVKWLTILGALVLIAALVCFIIIFRQAKRQEEPEL